MAIVSQSDLKTALGISGTSQDTLLTALAAQADAVVKSYCGQFLESATYSLEEYTGDGTGALKLKQRPVTAVASLKVDTSGTYAFGSDTLLTAGTNYRVRWTQTGTLSKTGIVDLLFLPSGTGGGWPLGWAPWANPSPSPLGLTGSGRRRAGWPQMQNCIQVTYTAGFATIPDDLKSAAVSIGCWLYASQPNGGLISSGGSYIDVSAASLTAATESLRAGSAPLLASARQILNLYRDTTLAWGP